MEKKYKQIIFALYFFGVFYANSIYSNSYGEIYGAHARANGMGNAVTSIVSDSSAVFYNPAGLGKNNIVQDYIQKKKTDTVSIAMPFITKKKTLVDKKIEEEKKEEKLQPAGDCNCVDVPVKKGFLNEITLHGNYTKPLLKASGGQSEDIKNVKDSYGGLGLTIDLNNFVKLGRNARFGLNILLPATGNLLAINDVNPTSPKYLQHGRSLERPVIMGGVGIEVIKNMLYAGVGFNALVRGRGSALLKNVQVSPDTTIPNQQVILDVKPMVNPTFGLMFQWKNYYAGVSLKREIYSEIDPLSARAQTAILGIQFDVQLALLAHFTPRTINYGVGYRYKEKYLFTIDINRELWSAYRLSSAKATYTEPIYLKDISNPRLGFEYNLQDNATLRAGFGKRLNPTRLMPGENNLIDFERRIFTLGATYAFFPSLDSFINTPIVLDIVIEQHSLKSIVNYKYMPNIDNQSFVAKGKVYHAGFSLTLFF